MELPHHLKDWSREEEKTKGKIMDIKDLQALINTETYDDMLLMDGFEDALIGTAQRCGQPRLAVYSVTKMIDVLVQRDHMDQEEAMEYIEYNCIGAWMGELTPIIVEDYYA